MSRLRVVLAGVHLPAGAVTLKYSGQTDMYVCVAAVGGLVAVEETVASEAGAASSTTVHSCRPYDFATQGPEELPEAVHFDDPVLSSTPETPTVVRLHRELQLRAAPRPSAGPRRADSPRECGGFGAGSTTAPTCNTP